MQLNLKNGYEYNLPSEGRLLLFGANRIGKTLISKEINNYYENIEGYKVLLFNDDLLQSSLRSVSYKTVLKSVDNPNFLSSK